MPRRGDTPQTATQSARSSGISGVVDLVVPLAIAAVIVVLVLFAPRIYVSVYGSLSDNVAGDTFAALTALFTALAFGAMFYAAMLQRRELALQRQELVLTRNELALQRLQMATQSATFEAQRFEDTFFQLLRVHQDIVEGMSEEDSRSSISGGYETVRIGGRECFLRWYGMLRSLYNGSYKEIEGAVGTLERARSAYLIFYRDREAQLGHYFRNLYNIIRFIDDSSIPDKQRYARFVRAQLRAVSWFSFFTTASADSGVRNSSH